jgi:hypothetical protein
MRAASKRAVIIGTSALYASSRAVGSLWYGEVKARRITSTEFRERVHRARIALDLIEEYAPEAKMSPLGSNDLGIPEV